MCSHAGAVAGPVDGPPEATTGEISTGNHHGRPARAPCPPLCRGMQSTGCGAAPPRPFGRRIATDVRITPAAARKRGPPSGAPADGIPGFKGRRAASISYCVVEALNRWLEPQIRRKKPCTMGVLIRAFFVDSDFSGCLYSKYTSCIPLLDRDLGMQPAENSERSV